MALSKSNLLIRDYDDIRPILRDIYIFGCFSRDDFIQKGMSGRKYDNEQRRISAYLPEKFIRKRRVNKKVFLYCSYDMGDSAENYLADTYRNKSFTVLDIMSFFFIQQLLYKNGEMSAVELLEEIPVLNQKTVFTKDNLRVKLDELVDRGYIVSRKEGRNVYYRLSGDMWEEFSEKELIDICLYLQFMKNVSPIEMPYYFLEHKLRLYLQCERKVNIKEESIFSFKHSHLFNSLDNEILLDVLRGCEDNKQLQIETCHQTILVNPIYIIHDSTYGRQYLYCKECDQERTRIIRIDKIDSVDVLDNSSKESGKAKDTFLDEVWCTSGVGKKLEEVVIEFRFDEKSEAYILRRIEKEGHGGVIRKIEDGCYEYRIMVRDPKEMIPWIRSFGERAKVVFSGTSNIEETIQQDWKKALDKYEAIR